ncbi:MAG: beta strand repeat-containing protein [Candidatus Competibacteraceae bacterium]
MPHNEFLTGIRVVQQVVDQSNLLVQRAFSDQGQDNGATLPYIIGRAENAAILPMAFTDIRGVASNILTYPVSRLGQTAILVACTADGAQEQQVCTVLNTCNASGGACKSVFLDVTNGSDRTLTVSTTTLGPNRTTNVQMCLRDSKFSPLPATEIRYNIGSAGPATVTVNGITGNKGGFFTGGDGCAAVPIASSGQIPGSQPILLNFTSDFVAAPATITINAPGAGQMDGLFSCTFEFDKAKAKCTGILRLTDAEGSPMANVPIALGNVSAAGLYKLTFDPASGAFGKTNAEGQTNVVVEMDGPGAYEFPFQTAAFGTAKYTLSVAVPAPNALKITFTGGAGTVGQPYSAVFLADGGVPPYVWSLLSGQLPPGLNLNPNGSVSGTPTLDGAFSFVVQVTDDKKRIGFAGFTIVIGQRTPLTVTFSGQNGALNAPYSGVVSASGGTAPYRFSVLAGKLPPGLTLNSNGSMSGSPTEVGTFPFTVQASDSAATPATGTGNFIIVVTEGKLILTLNPLTGTLNAPFNGLVRATGGTEPYTFTQPAGWLPPGLTLKSDGSIAGSPTQVGAFQFSVQAEDKNGATGTQNFMITITEGVLKVALSISEGTLNMPFNSLLTATGGTLPYTFKILTGTLPPGLTLNILVGGGEITGTPTQVGSFPFVVQATDSSGATGTADFTITIGERKALVLTLVGSTTATLLQSYSAILQAVGGILPYKFEIVGGTGNLPPELTLDATTGVISGRPNKEGSYSFVAQVTDKINNTGFAAFTIVVSTGTPTEPLVLVLTLPAGGEIGQNYTNAIGVTGGTPPYTFELVAGKLPKNLTLNPNTGAISGIPTEVGIFPFSVKITDSSKPALTGTGNFTITISEGTALELALTGPATGVVGQTYANSIGVTGGVAPYRFELVAEAGILPNGLSLDPATGVIGGTPTVVGIFPFSVKVTDSKGTTGTGNFTITITGGGSGNVGSVVLLANPPQLATSGLTPVNLTAVIRSTKNVLLKDITVTFNAINGNGTIQVVREVTDETGTSTAILTSPGDKSNRDITVTASAGNPPVEPPGTVVPAVGTTITSSGPNSAVIGSKVAILFTLNDSAGVGIGGQTLAVTSEPVGNAVNLPNPVTNAAGQATVEVTATVSGNIVATALGATGTHPLSVATDNFAFIVPDPLATTGYPPDVCLINTNCTPPRVTPPQTLTVKLTSSGVGIAGKTVTFETTRGTLSTISAVTNAAGEATTTISSDNAGPAVITAKTTDTSGLPIQTQVQVNFVATTPTQMTLQAAPSTISVNVPPSISQTSTITATVRDVNFNLVKGVTVNFTLTDVTGGAISPASQITDQFGQASTVYTASSSPSALNGVKVDAAVAGFPVIGEVTLTVAQQALFITLGTGNLIAEPTTTTFALPYSALVTDTAGLPVANAVINLNVVPVATSTGLNAYGKGYWQVTKGATPPWSQVITAGCLNEDLNQNGILDPGEDFNGNGRLDPGNVATVSKTSLTTDATGFAYFDVLYAQQYAQWVREELTARANVAGSQATETARFILPILASKLAAEGVSPPGNPSPYGFATTCANPN